MAEQVYRIKPGGTPGVDCEYTSLNAFETGERANLITFGKNKVAEVYSTGNCLTGPVSFNTGWTTDSTHYIEIRAASGHEHDGIWDTSKAYGVYDTNDTVNTITVNVDVHINKIQFSSTQVSSEGMLGLIYTTGSGKTTIDRCILKLTNNYIGIPLFQIGNAVVIVTNSVVLLKQTSNGYTALCVKAYGYFTAYNSTFVAYDYSNGDTNTISLQTMDSSAVITTENCYLKSSAAYWNYGSGTFNKGSKDATSSGDATDSNLQNIAYSTATFQNVTFGSENLRLVPMLSNKLLDGGVNLISSGVTTDIIGTARPQFGAFDIGAFENDIPLCWNYTAQYKGSSKLFKASGCGPFPRNLQVPSNVDKSTGKMVDDGEFISPNRYNIC